MRNFDRKIPFNDLPLLPPKVGIETKNILRKTIAAGRALAPQTSLIIIALILLQSINICAQTAPSIESFNLSKCKENCFIKADLISISKIKDTLLIEAGINLNCCGNFRGSFEFLTKDTLNLIIKNQPDENGVYKSCSCNCYYVTQFKILNAASLPKIILINGRTFEENRNDAGWFEEEIPE